MNYLRLKKNADFQKLFKRGNRVFSSSLTLFYSPSREMTMGVAISKKHGKAVKRNYVKRLAREAFSHTQSALQKPYSIIILPKVAEEYSLKNFEKCLLHCFKKMNSGEGNERTR